MLRNLFSILCVAVLVLGSILVQMDLIDHQIVDILITAPLGLIAFGLTKLMRTSVLLSRLASLAVFVAALLAIYTMPDVRLTPYAMIAVINIGVGTIFLRGLLPGREPALVQLIAAMGKAPLDNPDFRRFVVGQCALWVACSYSFGGFAAIVMCDADLRADFAWILLPFAGVQMLVFIASHYYAKWQYARPETWLETLKSMTDRTIWATLRL